MLPRTVLVVLLAVCASGHAETLVTANALFDGRAMLTIDGRQRLLKVGQSSPEGVKLLSSTAREAVVEVEGRRITLGLSREIGAAYAAPERREVAVQRNGQGQYRIAGSVNGHQLMFMVDTGANVVALSGAEAARLGIDFRREGERVPVQTAGGLVGAWSVTLDRVEVSGILVRNVPATVIEGPHPSPALLGMSWLTRVGIREEGGVMYLRER